MKAKIFLLALVLFGLDSVVNGQIGFWGITSNGGVYGIGVIFNTDDNGNNLSVLHNFNILYEGKNPGTSLCQASNGKLYGMTRYGGAFNEGVLFEYDPVTNSYVKKYDFNGTNGSNPYGNLIQASNGKLYGMTYDGGNNNKGVIFEYDVSNNTYTKVYDFDDANGAWPYGSLVQASNGKLYGMTTFGGNFGYGVIFEYDVSTNTYVKKYDFDGTNGSLPLGSLIQANNGKLYGMTSYGGTNQYGVIFEYDLTSNIYLKLYDFDGINGSFPCGSFIQANNGKLYGMAYGGSFDNGVIFEYDIVTNTYTTRYNFNGINGGMPEGSLTQASNNKLYGMTPQGGSYGIGVIFEYDLITCTYTKLFDFVGNNGKEASGSFILGSNGKLFGVTTYGGSEDYGVLFEFDPNTNTFVKKFNFNESEGSYPLGNLIQASNGKLYGLTSQGGSLGYGTLFEYDLYTYTFTKKFDFDDANGSFPYGSLIQASNGKLYGMTNSGGTYNKGVIFEYDLYSTTYTKVFDFDGINGSHPQGSLIQANNGKLYGMTNEGGIYDYGVIFEYDPSTNTYIKKFDFDGNNGGAPYGSLCQANNGKLYGMTWLGGISFGGVIFEYDPATNTYSKKFDFTGFNGGHPYGSLIQASNEKLYGMTTYGGVNDNGIIFEYDLSTDTFIKKFDFDGINGTCPVGSLIQASNGKLYGMTQRGGDYDYGVLFEYDLVTNIFTKKFDFDQIHGIYPYGSLIEITCLPTYGTDNVTACKSFTWIDGNTYTFSTNTPTYTLTNSAGCDSIVTLNLTIIQPDVNVTNNSPTLIANATGVTYQWVDCDNNFAPIPGETGQSFTATANGNYAVIITQHGCTDTSACFSVTNVSLSSDNSLGNVNIYPNPSNGIFYIDFPADWQHIFLIVRNPLGQTILHQHCSATSPFALDINELSGVYYLEILSDKQIITTKLIKK